MFTRLAFESLKVWSESVDTFGNVLDHPVQKSYNTLGAPYKTWQLKRSESSFGSLQSVTSETLKVERLSPLDHSRASVIIEQSASPRRDKTARKKGFATNARAKC